MGWVPINSTSSTPAPDGGRWTPIDAPAPRSVGSPQKMAVGDWRGHLEQQARMGAHALPYAAAAAGPEGALAGAAVQGLSGASEEFGVQTLDRLKGTRKEYDWNAVAWAGGMNTAFSAGASAVGKVATSVFKAGKYVAEAPVVRRLIGQGEVATPGRLAAVAQDASDELKSKTAIDSLGQKLGMTAQQSDAMTSAYDQGRQVGDAVYQADRTVGGEFKTRYDDVLKPYEGTPVDGVAVQGSVQQSLKWLQETGNTGHVRPGVLKQLQKIGDLAEPEEAAGKPPISQSPFAGRGAKDGALQLTNAQLAQLQGGAPPKPAATVASLRGYLSELRATERQTNLTDVEESVVGATQRALSRTIKDVVKPHDAEALKAIDADYGVYKSNFRTFWKALKDKKSLSEVGDAIYDQFGKRPDALRYLLSAADRAGRSDDMRTAFLNKMWRESQGPGGAVDRAQALAKYVANFGPGSKGQDVLQMVLGKHPGITQSVGQFTQRIEDMSTAQKAIKDPTFLHLLKRVVGYRLAFGLMAGGGLGMTYNAFQKDPAQATAVSFTAMASIGGLMAVIKNPTLVNAWATWIASNPKAPEFISQGVRVMKMMGAAGVQLLKEGPDKADDANHGAGQADG